MLLLILHRKEINVTIKTNIETITPALAREYLTRRNKQRPITASNVKRWVDQMKSGQWTVNNDALTFDEFGNLINGQHRLSAVVEVGSSFSFLVLRGVPSDSFMTMDQGRQRSGGDTLASIGFRNPKDCASIARILIALRDTGTASARGAVEKAPLAAFADKHAVFLEEAADLARASRKLFPASQLGAILFQALHVNEAMTREFAGRIASGTGATADDPVLRVRNKLMENRNKKDIHTRPETTLPLLVSAWEAFIHGRTMSKLMPATTPFIRGFKKEQL